MVMTNTAPRPRAESDPAYTWNAESVFPSKAEWEAACDALPAMIQEVEGFRGTLSTGPGTLLRCMEAVEKLLRAAGRVYVYGAMSSSVDTTDQDAQAMAGRGRGLISRARAAGAFLDPELIAIGRETLDQWMDEEPALASFRHYIDNVFRKQAHTLSADVERVMGLVSDPFSGPRLVYDMLTNAELPFRPALDGEGNEVPVTQGNRSAVYRSTDRALRRSFYESFMDAHLQFKNTLGVNVISSFKQNVFNARARGYESSLHASLHENNIPVEVFHNLIDTFKKHLPTWHKYWDVRRRILGYDSLHPYDVWAPLAGDSIEVPYHQAVDWISEGMQPLGDDYVAAMRRGCLEDRWVDLYPNIGKRQGAFSNGTHETFPFIMMSYTDDLGSMSTLAHELGHSMHSYNARRTQNVFYSGYSLFVAEVASNFNQALTRAYLREAKADDTAFQIALIEEAMGNFHRYFFIMPTLARFELEVHSRLEQGKGVTANDMIALMADLFGEGYGSELQYERDREGITWATFGHLYANYYVYQYATGISAAHALADRVLNGGADAARRYVEFLSAGSSLYPLDALKHAGVDMTTPEPVEVTFGVLGEYVDRLATLAGVS